MFQKIILNDHLLHIYKQIYIFIIYAKEPLGTKTSGSFLYHTNDSTK